MAKISSDTLRIAIILGVVLPGVGHMYLGQINRGIKIVMLLIFTGTVSAVLFSYVNTVINMLVSQGPSPALELERTYILNIVAPAISLIPLIVWVWQVRDLRQIIKKLAGYSIDQLEPPLLEMGINDSKEGITCPACGRSKDKESQICGYCGFRL
jgi:TM2 domain-containing membrane protein YozV